MFTERVWTRSIAPIDQAIHGDCRKKTCRHEHEQSRHFWSWLCTHSVLLPTPSPLNWHMLHPSDLGPSWLLLHMCYYYLGVCVKVANPHGDQANKVHRKLLHFQPRNIGIRFQALLNEGIYPWNLNLFNSWLLALSLEGLTKNKKHQETQRRENHKKKLVWAWSSHYPWVFFLFFFDHGFNPAPLLTKASEPLSNAISIAGTIIFNGVACWVPKEVGYKNRWFQARIREIFGEKTFPWKIAGLFVEPRRCLCLLSLLFQGVGV